MEQPPIRPCGRRGNEYEQSRSNFRLVKQGLFDPICKNCRKADERAKYHSKTGAVSRGPQTKRTLVSCEACGTKFKARNPRSGRPQQKFCTSACALSVRIKKTTAPRVRHNKKKTIYKTLSEIELNVDEVRQYLNRLDVVILDNGCMQLKGSKVDYPTRTYKDARVKLHRLVAYAFHCLDVGDKKQHACHNCDNPKCINPRHIYKGDALSNGDDKRRRLRYGESSHTKNKVLDPDRVREIRRYRELGLSTYDIAEIFQVNRKTISAILNGRTWKYVK